jgi:hypothetical protein
MTLKDNILLIVWLGIVVASVGACYKVYVMDRGYEIVSLVECDPTKEACFVLSCDGEDEDYNEDLCRQVDQGARYFSFIRKKAKNIESCDARFEQCESLACQEQEEGCEYIQCDAETLEEYGDESMRCTAAVIAPQEVVEEVAPAPVIETPLQEESVPSVDESIEAEQKLLDAQEESLRQGTTVAAPAVLPVTPAPVETTPTAPVEESVSEPNHNLPI